MLRISNGAGPINKMSQSAQIVKTSVPLSEMGYSDPKTGEWMLVKVFQDGDKMITSRVSAAGKELYRNTYKAIGKMLEVVG